MVQIEHVDELVPGGSRGHSGKVDREHIKKAVDPYAQKIRELAQED